MVILVFFLYCVFMKVQKAVAAVLVRPGAFLAVRRKQSMTRDPGVWEFPGGKIEPGETEAEAIQREVQEELGVGCIVLDKLFVYEFEINKHNIHLTYYLCEFVEENPKFVFVDHDAWQWFKESDFKQDEWLAGDEQILAILKNRKIL